MSLYDVRQVGRVLIASRDAVTAAYLRRRLEDGGCEVTRVAADEDAVLAAVREDPPDVVVLHLPRPASEALRLARRLRTWHPGVALIGFSAASDGPSVLAAVDAGIRGYVLSDDDALQIVSAVQAVIDAGSPLSPKVARALIDARAPGGPEQLTDRERDVLDLLGEGLSNKDIAARLGIAERTVKAHLTSAFRRLGVQRRTQAAMWVRDQHKTADEG
jgi:DNA-binding NarL/FixJ family response regulator